MSVPADDLLSHPYLAELDRRLRAREPRQVDDAPEARRAAVALIHRVRDREDAELLLVKRAEYAGDPWSGHVALPGGRHESGETLADTAIRETFEETAIDLRRVGRIIGALDDLYPRNPLLPPLVITPFVAAVRRPVELQLSSELADAFWVPVSALLDPSSRLEVELEVAGSARRVPSFQHAGYTVWGITHRILDQYLDIVKAD